MSTKKVVFRLNEEEYGIDISEVNTVEKDMVIKRMLKSPNTVKGKTNLRGNDIPVYSLRRKFGFKDIKPDKNTRHLIISVDEMDIAFEVDQVKGIIDIEESNIFDVPEVIKCDNTQYIKSIANVNGELVLVLDSKFLVDNEELLALQAKNKR